MPLSFACSFPFSCHPYPSLSTHQQSSIVNIACAEKVVLKLLAPAPWDQPGFVRCRGNPHRQSPTGSGLCEPKEGDVCRVMCPQQSLSRQGRSKTTGGTLEEGAIWGFSDVYDVANILRGQKLDTFFPLLLTGYTFLFGVPSALLSC